MGSKRRIAKDILPIILQNRKKDQYYIEPFVGGCNSIDKVKGKRIGNDNNKYLIDLFKYLQKIEIFNPPFIDEDKYNEIKNNKENYPDWLVGFVGFNLSFGSSFFGVFSINGFKFRNGVKTKYFQDYFKLGIKNLENQKKYIEGIKFYNKDYKDLEIPKNSIIYCDPPYRSNKTYYKNKFNHKEFYNWCRKKNEEGHEIYISEYSMPKDFKCIWEKEIAIHLNSNAKSLIKKERLFTFSNIIKKRSFFQEIIEI